MPDQPIPVGDVQAALDAAEKLADIVDSLDEHQVLTVAHRNDVTLTQIDLERYLDQPDRQRGTVKAITAEGFVTAFKQRTLDHTPAAVYADPGNCRLVAVLNDDEGDAAGWRDHRIELALADAPEWIHWTGNQGLGTQTRFAEAIEGGETEIVSPSATVMLEIAQTFDASVGAKFKQRGRLKDGSTQFVYEAEVDAKASTSEGEVRIPDRFTISVRPFYGAAAREAECRIRYRVSSDGLQIGYTIYRPDEIRHTAFTEDVVGWVREELAGFPIIEGTPAPTTPTGR